MEKKDIISGRRIETTKGSQDKRITISREGLEVQREGKPVSFKMSETGFAYLLVDCSGSMGGNNLNQAKNGALNFAKEALGKGYLIGLIQFESVATHLCEPQREISVLKRHLEDIGLGSTTNMTEAIYLATQKLLNKAGFRVIVVATDGMPDDPKTALEAAEKAKKNKIDIITIGTDDADQDFLKKLASRTELGVKVSREQFEKSITSAASMLPRLGPGKKGG